MKFQAITGASREFQRTSVVFQADFRTFKSVPGGHRGVQGLSETFQELQRIAGDFSCIPRNSRESQVVSTITKKFQERTAIPRKPPEII